MSSLPSNLPAVVSAVSASGGGASGGPDAARWVAVDEAARLLAMHRDALSRRCRRELVAQGLAMRARPAGGGVSQWWVSRRLDPRLLPGVVGRGHAVPSLDHWPESKRTAALTRRACVEALRHAREQRPGLMRDWLPGLVADLARRHPELRVSRSTLLRWDALYTVPADLVQLIDSRGGDQSSAGDPDCWAFFREAYLDERQPSARECWRQTRLFAQRHRPPLAWCSYGTLARQLDTRITPEQQAYHRDPRKWRTTFAPYIKQDPERFAAGRCWVGDHTPLDLFCRWRGAIIRPYVTAWQDWRTRRWCGWVLAPSPSSASILAALRRGLIDDATMGGPTEVLIDNGKDYDAWMFHGQTKHQRLRRQTVRVDMDQPAFAGIFGLLNIQAHHSIAYAPNGKARMERSFRTLHEAFDRSFTTYCGRNPEHKPESLNDLLAAGRNIPTFEQVAARLDDYVAAGLNASAEHNIDDLERDGVRLSPDEAMRSWCTTPLLREAGPALDLMLMQWHKPVSITREGVTVAPFGRSLSYGMTEPALSHLKGTGRQVIVAFDPDDLRTVRVYDDRLALICVAGENDIGGLPGAVGHERVRALTAQKRRYTKALKEVQSGGHTEYLTTGEQIAAGLDRPQPPEAAASRLRIGAADETDAPRDHRPHKQAAGAETVGGDDAPPRRALPSLSGLAEVMGLDADFPAGRDHDNDDDEDGPSLSSLHFPGMDAPTLDQDDETPSWSDLGGAP